MPANLARAAALCAAASLAAGGGGAAAAPPAGVAAGDPGGAELASGRVHELRIPAEPEAPARGPADAVVTVDLYSSLAACPPCAALHDAVASAGAAHADRLRVRFRHLPLPRRLAREASEVAVEAHAQGRFWDLFDALAAARPARTRADLLAAAARAGMDVGRLRRAMARGAHRDAVARDLATARRLGVRAPPAAVVGGRVLPAGPPGTLAVRLESLVRQAIERAAAPAEMREPRPHLEAREPPPPRLRIDLGGAPAAGSAAAPVLVAAFLDLSERAGIETWMLLARIAAEPGGRVRAHLLHLPGDARGRLVHEAAIEAERQGLRDALIEELREERRPDRGAIERAAAAAGLDQAALRAALDAGRHRGRIERDLAQARALGVGGAPAVFVAGRRLPVPRSEARLRAAIEEEARAGILGRLR